MTTRYYVDAQGAQLGGFVGNHQPPPGATEVPAPADGRDTWDFQNGTWVPYPPRLVQATRDTLDAQECQADKLDAQLVGDMNKTAQEIADVVDALFPGPTYSNGQRAFLRRVARLAQHGARGRKLRNGS